MSSLPPFVAKQLLSLGYPLNNECATGISRSTDIKLDVYQFQKIVVWLEETKIRLYSKAERSSLHNFNDQNCWLDSLVKYCQELGMSIQLESQLYKSDTLRVSIVSRLCSLALQDVYIDAMQDGTIETGTALLQTDTGDTSAIQLSDRSNLIQTLNVCLTALELPILPCKGATDQSLIAALKCLSTRFDPPECKETGKPNLSYPVGFKPADSDLRQPICILRLLHGSEMRKLQDHLNDLLAKLQTLTADPKTDSKLGRVGH